MTAEKYQGNGKRDGMAEVTNGADCTIPGYTAGTWTIDPTHSEIGFVVRHFGLNKVRGRFNQFEGTIVTAPDASDSHVEAKISSASIDTGNEQRDDHLRSDDFLHAAACPLITFTSTAVAPATDGGTHVIRGDLTLNGLTRKVELLTDVEGFGPDPMTPGGAGARCGFSARTEISRRDFGITFDGTIPGGQLVVGDKIEILLDIQAVLTPPAVG